MADLEIIQATIPAGQTVSAPVGIGFKVFVGFAIPTIWASGTLCSTPLADVERDLICTCTAEGRSRAQKRGQHLGRPPNLTAAQQAEVRRRRAQGATLAELGRSCHVGKSTISRL